MDLDEEDYELLGYGQADKPQKYTKKTNERESLSLVMGGASWVKKTGDARAVAVTIAWKKKYPERSKANNKRYRQSAKGKATAARYSKMRRDTKPELRVSLAVRKDRWYNKLKQNPVRYAAHKAKHAKNARNRRKAKRGSR